jgi:tRNA(Met) C34 N-acetyltransferase TmcA
MKPGIINLSDKKIKLENGCVLSTVAASKSPATGDSINLLYIDEAALIPANIIDEYWASVYPTLSSFRGS